MSSGKQTLIGAGGAGLLLVNFWTGPDRATVQAAILNPHASPAQRSAGHAELVKFGAALLVLVGAVIAAGVSDAFGTAAAYALAALWVLWLINRTAPATVSR
jgi:hypothetical protein